MPTTQNLYAIAAIAPEPIHSEVIEMQMHFETDYHSKATMNVAPHITFIPPFTQSSEKESDIFNFLKKFASKHKPIELSVNGFTTFGIGVIYAAFDKNEALKNLEKQLNLSFRKQFKIETGASFPFVPHITLAFKDLTPAMFELAWKEFQDKLYRRKWMMNDVALLRFDGKLWNVIETAELGTGADELELGF